MFSICQRYALKANHNLTMVEQGEVSDVFNMSKIRFESKWISSTKIKRNFQI